MTRRLTRFLGAAALQVVALVLAHELVFLARYGSRYNEALVHGGHGESWSAAVTTSLALAVGLLVLGTFRIVRLGLLVRQREAAVGADAGTLAPRSLLRAWLRVAPRTAVLSVVLLSVQENLERAAIGQAAPGPGLLLSPEYAGGLWITVAVGLAVGLVAALFEWRRSVLLARLRAAGARRPRRTDTVMLRPGVFDRLPVESLQGRRSALRAPPRMSAA
jgi:hypothetical protein